MKQIKDGEVVVVLRQDVKKGGELLATYRMDYPDLPTALRQVGSDLKAGRVESISVGGRQLTDQELEGLTAT